MFTAPITLCNNKMATKQFMEASASMKAKRAKTFRSTRGNEYDSQQLFRVQKQYKSVCPTSNCKVKRTIH
jgi:hypothetical protein